MRARLARVTCALAIVGAGLLPPVVSRADPKAKLEEVNQQLDELRERIDATAARKASETRKKLDLERAIRDLREEVEKLDADIERIESKVRSVQARIDETQAEIDLIEEAASEQAVSLYKSGGTEALDALLESTSLVELDDRAEMLGVAAEHNTDSLIELGRLKAEIEDHNRELFARKQELDQTVAAREKALGTLEVAYAEHAAEIERLEATLDEQHEHEGDLEAASLRLERELLERTVKTDVAKLGISAGGFIWPLNGAINSYYGPRWGRMHTGLDIDGETGDPIVASKAGRVMIASSYSGYGLAVVIDHGGGIATLYAHQSKIDVSVGQEVSQGQIIGYVGCTGSCTGSHLHFEVRAKGSPVDPMDYLP